MFWQNFVNTSSESLIFFFYWQSGEVASLLHIAAAGLGGNTWRGLYFIIIHVGLWKGISLYLQARVTGVEI